MAHYSMLEDIEDEIINWGYSVPISNYEESLNHVESHTSTNRMVGRGRGIASAHHMANIRLASEIDNLNVHPFRMGHLPTSTELLACSPEAEITPMLRQLGLNSREGNISSKTTRKNPAVDKDIHIDGTLPIILNGDLFDARHIQGEEDKKQAIDEEIERFNPELPLHEQFSTIPELLLDETNPPRKSKPKKEKSTNSSSDSGISSSTSCNVSAVGKQAKGKKKKWRKMTPEEMQPAVESRDRYEEVYNIGVHANALNSVYAQRQVIGSDGLKVWRN
ncbi:uncharacterized protein LOC129780431 isoform X2 [Toxorhynchites rutilus septentrionalis]|uniref:uncharacterized protein LOC129780431 isoform X2 n=1 Tax=Toxorhynchites rutilus septentrionalis TaxID=329112 RepID=UPI002479F17E|nr:uncharacterized protein LOC129780431 isoform X2 [Toxorhynchites rutilus septentrionalis]XP_055644677.1 uncharacterized protein LOC129780431 isoform X2 [Toxorhynchites rutilus septentrionalis]